MSDPAESATVAVSASTSTCRGSKYAPRGMRIGHETRSAPSTAWPQPAPAPAAIYLNSAPARVQPAGADVRRTKEHGKRHRRPARRRIRRHPKRGHRVVEVLTAGVGRGELGPSLDLAHIVPGALTSDTAAAEVDQTLAIAARRTTTGGTAVAERAAQPDHLEGRGHSPDGRTRRARSHPAPGRSESPVRVRGELFGKLRYSVLLTFRR